jgi:hypothetical protein
MPTFDGENLIMTLDPAPGGVAEIDVFNDMFEPWKDWMLASPLNRKYPYLFRSDGGNPLSSIINQGSYIFQNNAAGWRIKPYEQNGTWYLTGNLAVEDTSLPAFAPTDGAFTAAILGLQPVTQGVTPQMAEQLEYASFESGVWIDQANGIAGVDGTKGNAQNPVNNVPDAVTISANRGLPDTFYILNDLTIGSGDALESVSLYGKSGSQSTLTVNAAADTLGIRVYEMFVTGNLDGDSTLHDCILQSLNYINGEIHGCRLEPGNIVLGGSSLAEFDNCRSGVPGQSTPVIDGGGDGPPLTMRDYVGGIKLINKTGTAAWSIDLDPGQCIIDLTTVTNGTIVVRGTGKVIDQLGNHLSSGTYGNLTLFNEATFGGHLHDIWQGLGLDPSVEGTITPEKTAQLVWNAYLVDHTTADTFGHYVQKKLLKFTQFLGLK